MADLCDFAAAPEYKTADDDARFRGQMAKNEGSATAVSNLHAGAAGSAGENLSMAKL